MELLWDVFKDTAIDCLKMLPFLFLAFFLLELLEQRAADRMNRTLEKAGVWGPLAGAGLGLVPQCGFSVLASNFYVGGLISMGTLLAVYLSTSDEALVILLTDPAHAKDILPLLLSKFVIAAVFGYLIFFVEKAVGRGAYRKAHDENVARKLEEAARRRAQEEREEGELFGQPSLEGDGASQNASSSGRRKKPNMRDVTRRAVGVPEIADQIFCPCGCGRTRAEVEAEREKRRAAWEERARHFDMKAALYPAFRRTEEIFLYLFLATFLLNLLVELVGLEAISRVLLSGTPFEPLVAVIIGLIPNCAASVILTQLYFEGVLSFGAAIGGLCAGAGLGLLVLFRVGKNTKENLLVLGLLFAISVLSGSILKLVL